MQHAIAIAPLGAAVTGNGLTGLDELDAKERPKPPAVKKLDAEAARSAVRAIQDVKRIVGRKAHQGLG